MIINTLLEISMKRSTMKSNITLQPRCRPEGRLFPRRKVATKASLLNGVGDFDMELSLAIKESLKYAQQEKREEMRENGLCVSNDSSDYENKRESVIFSNVKAQTQPNFNKATKSNFSAMAAPSSDSVPVTEEVGRLKDLVLSQAELIQCQQEEMAKKDKEIKALISANDALQCRLERMERRMSILKHKEESHEIQGTFSEETSVKPTAPSHSSTFRGQNEITKIEFKKKRRHKLLFSQKKGHKKPKYLHSTVALKEKDVQEDSEMDDNEEGDKSSNIVSGEDNEDSENETDQSEIPKGEEECKNKTDIPQQEEKTIDYPVMLTETLYHLYYPKHVCSSPDAKKIHEQSEVETPSWRLKPLTNMYQLEGTENITDEAYNKRHQKFEMEEKRRKRWDLQRLRELRLFEKLQRQREDAIRASQDEVDVETFLPSVHDLKHIEITESIPVMAFGQPVPYVCPAEFEIPWEITSSGPTSPINRLKINSVHSKKH